MKLQQKVKQYRQAAGITLREMGGIAGISNSTLCRIEQEGSCNLDVLVKLAKFFHTTTDDLLGVTHELDELTDALDKAYESLDRVGSMVSTLCDDVADIQKAMALVDEQMRVYREVTDAQG